ncbi:MAG: type II secretion system protein, partial [Candidatus Aminicenantes bacterium]
MSLIQMSGEEKISMIFTRETRALPWMELNTENGRDMTKKLLAHKNRNSGFTLIEMLIVFAL